MRGVALEEVTRVTRIPRSTLELFEADDWERLPGRAYIVGYIRAYASSVGLDAEELLLRYQEETGETPAMAPAPTPPPPRWKTLLPAGILISVMAVVVLVVVQIFARP